MQQEKIRVGILGATGAVGQRFVQLLADHPWFEISVLAASERSAGKRYAEATHWLLNTPIPERLRDEILVETTPSHVRDRCQIVFSALPASRAREVEPLFAAAGIPVFSNASAFRMEPDVPLVIPEVNPEHLALINVQRQQRGWAGFIVTNPNCSTIHLVCALKPLHEAFRVEQVMVTTLQAVSGAGFPGVASLDILDNLIPYIPREEEKIESEPLKLLGTVVDGTVHEARITISAAVHRVPVIDGHTEAVAVKLGMSASLEDVRAALAEFRGLPQHLHLPSAPEPAIIVREEPDRPQPRLDRDAGRGMATTIGRLRPDPVLDYKFVLLGHNTIRGAAGASILNAELALALGYLDEFVGQVGPRSEPLPHKQVVS